MIKIIKIWIILITSLVCINFIEPSTVRQSLLDNLNSGLKLLGNNDRRPVHSRYYFLNHFQNPGVSSNIAELVSQTFSPASNVNQHRQDTVTIEEGSSSLSDNSFMSGLLKLLGFDGAKVGAAAINGIVFLAQMVRNGANKFMDYMMTKTWDWYVIMDYVGNRIKNETVSSGTPKLWI